MQPRSLIRTLTLVAATFALSACLNDSDTIDGAGPGQLPDLAPEPTTPLYNSSGPSVKSLDRRNWEVVTIDAPRGQVEHRPTYAEPLVLNGGSARNGETFPTATSAMQLGTKPDAAAAEGALEAGWPAVLLVASPARMLMGMPPWMTMRGPNQASGVLPPSQTQDNGAMWMWVVAPAPATPQASTP